MSSAKAVSLKKLTSQTSASASAPLLHLRATEVLLKIAMYSILEAILDRVQLELKRLDGSLLRRELYLVDKQTDNLFMSHEQAILASQCAGSYLSRHQFRF